MDTEELTAVFENVGKSFGFSKVDAKFVVANNLTVDMDSEGPRISWRISDYLTDAPVSVMRDLAFTYYDVMIGRSERYTQRAIDYLLSDDFIRMNRNTYLIRNKSWINPIEYYDGIPVYSADIQSGSLLYSSQFRVIMIPETDTFIEHRPRIKTVARMVNDYPAELLSKLYCNKDHADCRHCNSIHRCECRFSRDINNPPYIQLCPHWVKEGYAI